MRAKSSLFAILALLLVLASGAAEGAPVQGDDTTAFFVAPGGDNSGPGTMAQPLASIQTAVNQAQQGSSLRKTIIVSKGTYQENVTLLGPGLRLYGGFDAFDGWSRKSTNVTSIAPTSWSFSTYPLRIASSATSAVVDGFTIVAPNASIGPAGVGGNSIAVYLDAANNATLSFDTIVSGAGGIPNPATPNGGTGSNGLAGQAGQTGGSPGAGGGACTYSGGSGGAGAFSGDGSTGQTGGGPGGAGGTGGTMGICFGTGGPGLSGAVGPDGANGSGGGAGSGGAVNATFGWLANAGLNGSPGLAGKGGGGGGGGGSGFSGTFCSSTVNGGGGGGGGGGGCLGGAGGGGRGGGSSIAIFGVAVTSANVFGGSITAGNGGVGGKGANGGSGGTGGNGGVGGTAASPAGNGGTGGKGGAGGAGGGGGGGAGGASFGIMLASGSLQYGAPIHLGAQGAGGAGGLPNGSAGSPGTNQSIVGPALTATMRQLDVVSTAVGLASGTVRSDTGWIDCAPDCTQHYADGIVVTLYALPSTTPDSDFGGWSGACTGTAPICQVTMSADQAATATFVVRKYALDVSLNGSGTGSVASAPVGIDCGATCAASFESGTMVTLTPTPGAYSAFAGWSGACTGAGPCVVTMSAAKSVTATFTLAKFALAVATSGTGSGSVASSPAGIDCGATCNVEFDALTIVTLTPTPAPLSVFASWSGACTGTGACMVTMDAAKSVIASFTPVSLTLSASKSGNGAGSVTSSPAGIDCGATCAAPFSALSQVTLTATAASGSSFASWSGCDSTLANQCTVAMTAARGVTATFTTPITYNVVLEGFQEAPWVITPATGGGTAVYDPLTRQLTLNLAYAGLTGAESAAHIHGPGSRGANGSVLVTLSNARPKQDVLVLTSQQETQLLAGQLYVDIHTSTHPDGEIRGQIDSLGAALRRTLTVTRSGDGSGSVSGSAEAGQVIACGGLCSGTVPDGKVVTLTAVAADGSSFTGWSGGCSGAGLCTLTMNASVTVTATFTTATTGSADLAATQTATPNPASAGKDVILTLTATNYGPSPASSVVLSSEATGANVIWSSPHCSGSGTVTCDAGTLAVGASATFTVVVRPPVAGTLTNIVVATAAETDPANPNNGSLASIPVNATPPGVPTLRYRLYSDVTKEHHFTTDLNEYNVLGTYVGTWVQEGTVGSVLDNPGPFNGVDSVPYYRLYNTATRWHHWTTDANEYYTLGYTYPGWNMEGVDGWILPTQAPGTTELYRLNYPALGSLHHWTIDANEYSTLISSFGWIGEPGAGFVVQ